MTPEELKVMPKGNFILAKTGVHPMKTQLPLFLRWGIKFDMPYEVERHELREVVYVDRHILEREIVRRREAGEAEDFWKSVEAQERQDSRKRSGSEARRMPLRTD